MTKEDMDTWPGDMLESTEWSSHRSYNGNQKIFNLKNMHVGSNTLIRGFFFVVKYTVIIAL